MSIIFSYQIQEHTTKNIEIFIYLFVHKYFHIKYEKEYKFNYIKYSALCDYRRCVRIYEIVWIEE